MYRNGIIKEVIEEDAKDMELTAEGPELDIMDCKHYELLKSSKCNEEILEASCQFEWRSLGCYEYGEKQCRHLALQWPRLDCYLDVNGVEVNPDEYSGEEILRGGYSLGIL
jgi:hypothetical protein